MNLINIENLTKSYTERKLFNGASFSLQEGEKVGVIGINGTGKTTLLKMIMGEEETDEGTVTLANHVVLRYLPQHPEFAPDKSSLECVLEGNVTDENRWSIESEAKAMMTRLGIKDFMQPAGQLSGGQRKRLALISVLLSPADILLLDEPTNHLDNEMADWLEDYLKKWRGALIMVTHDRYFLDNVVDRIFEFDGNGHLQQYEGGYTDYLEAKKKRASHAVQPEEKPEMTKSKNTAKTWKQNSPVKLKFSFKEAREYETIDDDIASLEEQLEKLEQDILKNATNSVKLSELVQQKEETQAALDEKMERWVYLSDLAEKIESQKNGQPV